MGSGGNEIPGGMLGLMGVQQLTPSSAITE
jgi:hypothetical protein